MFPATNGYVHFQFADYAKLTVIGVLIAGAGLAGRGPRELGAALALLPRRHRGDPRALPARRLDLAARGSRPRRVAVLLAMHVAIALITYNLLVHLAPVRAPAARDVAATRSEAGV